MRTQTHPRTYMPAPAWWPTLAWTSFNHREREGDAWERKILAFATTRLPQGKSGRETGGAGEHQSNLIGAGTMDGTMCTATDMYPIEGEMVHPGQKWRGKGEHKPARAPASLPRCGCLHQNALYPTIRKGGRGKGAGKKPHRCTYLPAPRDDRSYNYSHSNEHTIVPHPCVNQI